MIYCAKVRVGHTFYNGIKCNTDLERVAEGVYAKSYKDIKKALVRTLCIISKRLYC